MINRVGMLGSCLLMVMSASACQYLHDVTKVDYEAVSDRPPLDVPPDLSSITGTTTTVNADGETVERPAAPRAPSTQSTVVLPRYANIKLVRDGQSRYLVVQAEPSDVWEKVRGFFPKVKLAVEREDAGLGVIETTWIDAHAVLGPSGASSIMDWFAIFRGSDKFDKFRVRLERGVTPGTTEVYLTHSGLRDIPTENYDDQQPAGWAPRETEPELEAEMLQRLVIHLGGEPETATAIATAVKLPESSTAPQSTRLTRNSGGAPALALQDSLDRAWRRVGLSLDRVGFTVEDRDRSRGIYYVRYVDPDKAVKKTWWGNSLPVESDQYQIYVAVAPPGSQVEVRNKNGVPENSKVSERILTLLQEQLK